MQRQTCPLANPCRASRQLPGLCVKHARKRPLPRTRRDYQMLVARRQHVERIFHDVELPVLLLGGQIEPGHKSLVAILVPPVAAVLPRQKRHE